MESTKAKSELKALVNDLFMDFLYYDRKNCEDYSVQKMRELMDSGVFSKELMVEVFIEQINSEHE